MACAGVLMWVDAAISSEPQANGTEYIETKQPHDRRFITSVARLTTCKIGGETDIRHLVPPYPPDSRWHHEEGKVVMQLTLDPDSCVRKATILQSSGHYRLDKASLGFVMTLKFPPAMVGRIKTFDDGLPTFAFPMVWKLVDPIPYVPGDRCSGGATCVDDVPPPPKVEAMGAPPEPGDVWMPGYYVHYPKTGYQWNDGQWESPRPGYHWNAPRWDPLGSKWIFTAGSWERDQ